MAGKAAVNGQRTPDSQFEAAVDVVNFAGTRAATARTGTSPPTMGR